MRIEILLAMGLGCGAESPATLRCDELIHEDNMEPDATIIGGAVGLRVATAAPTPDPGFGSMFAKSPLFVRAGHSSQLTVPEGSPLAFWWGNRAAPTRALDIPACDATSAWLVFAGGYWVDEPSCVELVVRSADVETDLEIAVGASCP